MKPEINIEGEHASINLNGKLDVNLSIEIEEQIEKLINSGVRKLTFDMEGISYISSSGIRIFISSLRLVKQKGGDMVLINTSEDLRALFKTVGLDDLLKIL